MSSEKTWGTYHTQLLKKDYLFRYTKKEFVIGFLKTQSLYLTQMSRFDDKLEGISTFDITELLHSYKDYFQDNPLDYDGLSIHYRELVRDDAKKRLYNVRNRLLRGQKKHYVSCWFNSNKESDGMWRNYAKQDGFAIKLELKAFQNRIKKSVDSNITNNNQFVRVGKIKYQDFTEVHSNESKNSVLYLAYRKDLSFQHENEYRVVMVDTKERNQEAILYNIKDFSDLEISIICHPGMRHDDYEKAKIELEKYGNNISVQKSELEPFYQLISRTQDLKL